MQHAGGSTREAGPLADARGCHPLLLTLQLGPCCEMLGRATGAALVPTRRERCVEHVGRASTAGQREGLANPAQQIPRP